MYIPALGAVAKIAEVFLVVCSLIEPACCPCELISGAAVAAYIERINRICSCVLLREVVESLSVLEVVGITEVYVVSCESCCVLGSDVCSTACSPDHTASVALSFGSAPVIVVLMSFALFDEDLGNGIAVEHCCVTEEFTEFVGYYFEVSVLSCSNECV